nr:hypothetical protein [Tanacetum cinerariifolium]
MARTCLEQARRLMIGVGSWVFKEIVVLVDDGAYKDDTASCVSGCVIEDRDIFVLTDFLGSMKQDEVRLNNLDENLGYLVSNSQGWLVDDMDNYHFLRDTLQFSVSHAEDVVDNR